jgi:predicted phage terminase large subunit-like protein
MANKPTLKPVQNRREFDDALAQLGAELQTWIELECAAFDTDPVASRERRERAVMDYGFFCKTYFPHYVPTPYFSLFQQFVFGRFQELIDGPTDAREVHMAPRGEAKSTYETQLGSLWCICRALYLAGRGLPTKAQKHMICIVMNTEEQSSEMLAAIKAELEANPRLAQDFPNAVGQGRVWQATTVITANNIKIRIGGTGTKLRGAKNGPHRPDLVFLDDLENDENVKDKAQREKVQNYVLSAIIGLAGPAGGMDVFWVGTSLHYDAAINRVARKPGWRRRTFKSIMKMPDRMDLWDTWEGLYTSATTGTDEEKEQAEADALAFYQANRVEMELGAVVSWPEVRPLYRLMCMRATDHAVFNKEQQNEAGNDEDAPFKTIQFWVNRLSEWLFFGSIDPSMGKKNTKRDPSALLVAGINPKTAVVDVIEADIARRVPDLIISRAVELQQEFHCLMWEVESVAFQEFLYTELIKRAGLVGVPFPARPTPTGRDKELAILSLQPHTKNGLLRLHRTQSTLIEQLQFYPEADHDDGPDVLEMVFRLATEFNVEWKYTSAARATRGRRSTSRRSAGDDDDDD